MPNKLSIPTKSNFVSRPSVPSNQKQSATEFNALKDTINANYERLILDWSTDIAANVELPVGQKILFTDNVIYKIITAYNVGSPATWDGTKTVRLTSTHLRGAYDLSLTND